MRGATTAACCAILALCLALDALPVKYALPVAVVLTILSIRAKPLAATADAMRAFYYRHHGAIFLGEIGVDALPRPPPPGPSQLLVRVKAAALNPADVAQAMGAQAALLRFDWPRVVGFDFSGVVEAAGADANFKVGERVFGMIRGLPQRDRGTLAELVLVDADVVARCPPRATDAECAAVPLVGITAVKMLRGSGLTETPPSSPGPRVLVTGGAGGVGSIAIQLAKLMFGASEVVATASPGAKTELCASLGADRVVDYRAKTPWWRTLADEAKRFDAVLVTTGESAAVARAGLVARGGGIGSCTAPPAVTSIRTWLAEARVPKADVTPGIHAFLHSAWGGALFELFTGARSVRRSLDKVGARYGHVIGTGDGAIVQKLAELLEAGTLRPVIDRRYALGDAREALAYLRTGRAAGKVVVLVEEGAQ